MARNLNTTNKWRIEQFRKNNDARKSPESDFVCTVPKHLDCDVVTLFESDSDTDTLHSETVRKQDHGLYIIKPSRNRKERNGKNRRNLEMKSGTIDLDKNIITSRPTTRNAAKKKVQALSHTALSTNRKTAVVMPITKRNGPQDHDAVMDQVAPDKFSLQSEKADVENLGNHMDTSTVYAVKEHASGDKKTKLHADSDSDLSLFEISFEGKPNKSRTSPREGLRNPPPSPVDITSNCSTHSVDDPPMENNVALLPVESTFSSDDSDSDANSSKRRGGKGKQPANKRRKVVTKSSKIQADQTRNQLQEKADTDGEDIIQLSETVPFADKRSTAFHSEVPSANPVSILMNKESASKHAKPLASTATVLKEESVNRAVVRPNSSVIVIADDDEDDVVMLSHKEKDKQELDDLEYARRLQAQFNAENVGGARPRDSMGARPDTSQRQIRFADSPLPERSTRLLQAVGASPEVTQYIGSRGAQRQGAAPPVELDGVEQRLELLRELALHGDGVDDATFNEILGDIEPVRSTGHQASSRGPRPPSTVRRGRAGSNCGTSSRSQESWMENDLFQRALQGIGMDTTENMSYESLLELADRIGDAREAGVAPETLTQLPCRKYKGGQANQGDPVCRICLCEFEEEEELRTLNCFHEFHSECIDKWLQKKVTCPNCRERVALT